MSGYSLGWIGVVSALAIMALGVLGLHLSLWSGKVSLLMLAAGGLMAAVFALWLLWVLVAGLRAGGAFQFLGLLGLGLGLAPLFLVVLVVAPASKKVPRIHDISTDPNSPIEFIKVPSLRADSDNSLALSEATVAAQLGHYKNVEPLALGAPPVDVFARVKASTEALGWDVVHEDAASLRIEAVVKTPIMGFKDDVVVVVTPKGEGSIVNMRSASRIGLSDLGANANRIQSFLRGLSGE